MRPHLSAFRLRPLPMAGVCVVLTISLTASLELSRRRSERLARALYHAQMATNQANVVAVHSRIAHVLGSTGMVNSPPGDAYARRNTITRYLAISEQSARDVRFHREQERDFIYAADHPWVSTPVDQP
ncbi:hypothetical protein ACYOEI_01380 [Singulisphaera rosea]